MMMLLPLFIAIPLGSAFLTILLCWKIKPLADIIGMAIVNANLFGMDIERSIKEKWLDKA